MADTQPFDFKQPIVDPATGLPTQYFLDMLFGSGKAIDGKVGAGGITDSALTMAANRLLGRTTALTGAVEELTLSETLDLIGSAAWGDILFRGEDEWVRLAAGTSGHFLKTLGAGANPEWASAGGASGAIAAYVQWTGGVTPSIQASFNVDSVTRTATGRFTVTFTNALADALYPIFGMGRFSDAANDLVPRIGVDRRSGKGKETTHVDITINTDTTSTTDGYDWISITVLETPS